MYLKIVIASAGRRAHYLKWFKEALRKQDLPGEVIALDYRSMSPTLGLADRAYTTPAYNSPEYLEVIRDWFAVEKPNLFLVMNDYEMQVLSEGLADELRAMGCAVAVLDQSVQQIVIDKYRTAVELDKHGIPTPATYLGSKHAQLASAAAPDEKFIVKHRFGSSSTGLFIVETADLADAIAESAETALGADGLPIGNDSDSVVIQDYLPGSEYGVDGVFSVDGRSELLGLVARRKERMRDGDTDLATTVSADPFRESVRQLGKVFRPTGSIDIDFRETASGKPLVIDINPRMGGGYPFCHSAGADMPSALVRSLAGLPPIPETFDYELGVTTARREEFTVIAQDNEAVTVSGHALNPVK